MSFDRRSFVIVGAGSPIRIEENVGLTLGNGAVTIRHRDPYSPSLLEAAVTVDGIAATVITAAFGGSPSNGPAMVPQLVGGLRSGMGLTGSRITRPRRLDHQGSAELSDRLQ